MKREAFYHRKTNRLMRLLRVPRWQAVGLVEMLWNLTAREAPHGDVGKLKDDDIAAGIEWMDDAGTLVSALLEAGWIDASEEHRYVVHDWSQHCDDWVHAQVARSKRRFVDGTIPRLRHVSPAERKELASFFGLNQDQSIPREQSGDLFADDCDTSRDCRAIVTDTRAIIGDTRAQPILSVPSRSVPPSSGDNPQVVIGAAVPVENRDAATLLVKTTEKTNTRPRRNGFERAGEVLARMPTKIRPEAWKPEFVVPARECLLAFAEGVRAASRWGSVPDRLAATFVDLFALDVGALAEYLGEFAKGIRHGHRNPGESWGWLVEIARDDRKEIELWVADRARRPPSGYEASA